jgi:uncharacterized protein (DUF4415 family)
MYFTEKCGNSQFDHEQSRQFTTAKSKKSVKIPVKINYDADILEWFRSFGKGYQTRINAALREYMMAHYSE